MPQAETGTTIPADGGDVGDLTISCESPAEGADPDIPDCAGFVPPESFWLSKDSEFDWFDRNAFLERKESTKGNSNSKNLNPSSNTNASYSRSNSQQRFSVNLKSKAAIIGLPKTQKNTHVDSNRRQCKPANIRLFPKRSGSGSRAASGAVPVTEPSSPKVSCMGRVRSHRCRSRRRSSTSATPPAKPVKPVNQPEKTSKVQKTGLVSRITSLFRSEGRHRRKSNKSPVKVYGESESSTSRRNCVTVKPINSEPSTPPDPPALGGMNRFASGRRSENWTDTLA